MKRKLNHLLKGINRHQVEILILIISIEKIVERNYHKLRDYYTKAIFTLTFSKKN